MKMKMCLIGTGIIVGLILLIGRLQFDAQCIFKLYSYLVIFLSFCLSYKTRLKFVHKNVRQKLKKKYAIST